MNATEPRLTTVSVSTSRDAHAIFEVLQTAARGQRRGMPPGIASVDDLKAVMRGGVAFFLAVKGRPGTSHLEPVGAIGYRWERGTLRVFHVAVLEGHRRAGVARRLLEAVEAVGMALGSTTVSLSVGHESEHLALFERAGYDQQSGPNGAGRVQLGKAFGDRII